LDELGWIGLLMLTLDDSILQSQLVELVTGLANQLNSISKEYDTITFFGSVLENVCSSQSFTEATGGS
jgi:hypothetical protein